MGVQGRITKTSSRLGLGFNTVLNRILPTVVKKKGGRIPEHYRCLLNELMGNNLLLLS